MNISAPKHQTRFYAREEPIIARGRHLSPYTFRRKTTGKEKASVLPIVANRKRNVCHGSRQLLPEPGRSFWCSYLRTAQAYMLISMPTGTSTIFGVFQVIWISQVIGAKLAPIKGRTVTCLTQVPGQIPRGKKVEPISSVATALDRPAFSAPWRPTSRHCPDLLP
jgi:hypothetical protein